MNTLPKSWYMCLTHAILAEYGAVKVDAITWVGVDKENDVCGEFTAYIDGRVIPERMDEYDIENWRERKLIAVWPTLEKTVEEYNFEDIGVWITPANNREICRRGGLKVRVAYVFVGKWKNRLLRRLETQYET